MLAHEEAITYAMTDDAEDTWKAAKNQLDQRVQQLTHDPDCRYTFFSVNLNLTILLLVCLNNIFTLQQIGYKY